MNIPTPASVRTAHAAQVVREYRTPVYSTTTPTATEVRRALISRAQDIACEDDYCFICGRATDHWGEHDDIQILRWAKTRQARYLGL